MSELFLYSSPIGKIVLETDGKNLTSLRFYSGEKDEKDFSALPKPPAIEQTIAWLNEYFSGEGPRFTPPLSLSGTPFQKSVWKILLKIPYGKVVSYGYIAEIIAKERGIKRMSAQAVGGAVGANPIAIIVPCHRVVGKDFSLTGYAGGIDKKQALLKIERADLNNFYII